MNWFGIAGIAAALLLGACAKSPPEPQPSMPPNQSGTAVIPARSCLAKTGADRAMCVAMLGAMRTGLADSKEVCSPYSLDDLSDTYAVMDWIKEHPEVYEMELSDVSRTILMQLHPCP